MKCDFRKTQSLRSVQDLWGRAESKPHVISSLRSLNPRVRVRTNLRWCPRNKIKSHRFKRFQDNSWWNLAISNVEKEKIDWLAQRCRSEVNWVPQAKSQERTCSEMMTQRWVEWARRQQVCVGWWDLSCISQTSPGESVIEFTDLKCEWVCCETKEKAEEQKARKDSH